MTGYSVKKMLLPALCLLFFSCSNNEKKPADDSNGTAVNKDSAGFVRTESIINPYATVDKSPMDMSYYPADYPKLKMAKAVTAAPLARVIYSRPHLGGRKLFDEVLKYGEPWRLGANEATELQLYKDVQIDGKKVKAGRYVMYSIPQPDTWTIVLNTNIDSWGLHPDSLKDVFRFTVPAIKNTQHLEYFTMIFQKIDGGADLLMGWGDVEARLPIRF